MATDRHVVLALAKAIRRLSRGRSHLRIRQWWPWIRTENDRVLSDLPDEEVVVFVGFKQEGKPDPVFDFWEPELTAEEVLAIRQGHANVVARKWLGSLGEY